MLPFVPARTTDYNTHTHATSRCTKKKQKKRNKPKRQIFRKYLQNSAMQLQVIPEKVCSDMHKCIEQARDDKALLGQDLFLEVQKICFRQIFDHTFSALKKEHGSR